MPTPARNGGKEKRQRTKNQRGSNIKISKVLRIADSFEIRIFVFFLPLQGLDLCIFSLVLRFLVSWFLILKPNNFPERFLRLQIFIK